MPCTGALTAGNAPSEPLFLWRTTGAAAADGDVGAIGPAGPGASALGEVIFGGT